MKRKAERKNRKKKGNPATKTILSAIVLFEVSASILLVLKEQPLDFMAALLAALLPVMAVGSVKLYSRWFQTDDLMLTLTNFLCGLGVIVLYALSPERGMRQLMMYAIGLAGMGLTMLLVRKIRSWKSLSWLMIGISLALLALPVAIGKETNGAKNWISIPVIGSFQPSEVVKLALLVVLAEFFSSMRGLKSMLPGLAFAVACLGFLMLQKDLGTALMYYMVTLLLYWAASSNLPMTLLGAAGGAGAAVLGYHMFAHVKTRVAIWLNPWSDALGSGYQLVQALTAIASGGFLGLGLGMGASRSIPAYSTDFIFAVICEQFGILFGLCVVGLYVILTMRGIHIAMQARRTFHALLALGCALLIGLQTFVIIGGVIKLIPLTGITMPFVSYGGTSLVSCMGVVGMLCGVASKNQADLDEDARMAGGVE